MRDKAHWGFDGVVRKQGKPMDFRKLNRTLAWRRELSAAQSEMARKIRNRSGPIEVCPACLGGEHFPFISIFEFSFSMCNDCGHLFALTPPTQKAIDDLYTSGSENRASQVKVYVDDDLFRQRVASVATPKVEFVSQHVGQGMGKWFDVGCGTGEILAAAKQMGWSASGAEADADEVEFAKDHGLNVSQVFLTPENANSLLDQANIVSCFNIVEHIIDPRQWLSGVVAAMTSGTYLVVEVPRHPSISTFSNQVFPKLACRHICPPEHLHIFSEKSLETIFESLSLQAVAIWNFGQDVYDLLTCAATEGGLVHLDFYNQLLEEVVPALQKEVDRLKYSDNMIVVARKR